MVEANQSYIRPPSPPSPKSKQTDNHLFRPLENLSLDCQGKGPLDPLALLYGSAKQGQHLPGKKI